MCGITGWIDYRRDLSNGLQIIKNMSNTLAHRGPDESGTFVAYNVLFGHRRLTVVDPAGGQQPMTKAIGNNKFTMVYNGELYNTEEVRKKLLTAGYSFDSYSDTEVLLISYIHYGKDCLKHLNGIFAFAIWDERKKQLFMARDRMGVKPLFYYREGDSLIFGSEIKALLAHPDVEPVIDEKGIMEIFGLGPARGRESGVFKGVRELKPGFRLIFNREGLKTEQYWQLKTHPHNGDFVTTVEHVRDLFIDSVQRQLVSDMPVCTFLSGGLDSSAISSVTADYFKEHDKRLDTYSVDYKDNELYFAEDDYQPNSDSDWIPKVVEEINSKHHGVIVNTEELVSSLREAVLANDLPGMADIDSSLYLFTKEVKNDFTVALSGECADEIFGGYPWYRREADLKSDTFPWSKSLDIRKEILSEEFKSLPLESYVDHQYNQTLREMPDPLEGESWKERRIRELFYLNLKWFMVTLLTRKDRMSMANSLEVRVPFADHRLVEYSWNIPWKMKYYNNIEKGLLREAFKGIVPEKIRKRKKSPYPKTHNPQYTAQVKSWLKAIIANSDAPLLQLIDKKKVRELIEGKGNISKSPWFGQLMRRPQLMAYLIQVNIWMEEYNVRIEI